MVDDGVTDGSANAIVWVVLRLLRRGGNVAALLLEGLLLPLGNCADRTLLGRSARRQSIVVSRGGWCG